MAATHTWNPLTLVLYTVVLVATARTQAVSSSGLGQESCSPVAPPSLTIDASDFRLGGLVAMTAAPDTKYTCGNNPSVYWPALKAIEYSLKQINKDAGAFNGVPITESYIPGIKLSIENYDTCQSSYSAVANVMRYLPQNADTCSPIARNLPGIIGPSTDYVAATLTSHDKKYDIPYISFSATSPVLSDKTKYPNFFRTIPPSDDQTKAIIATLSRLNWTEAAIIYSDSTYGSGIHNKLLVESTSAGICFSYAQKISTTKLATGDADTLLRAITRRSIRVVVYAGDKTNFLTILQRAKQLGMSGLLFVATDSVGRWKALQTESAAQGVITIELTYRHNEDFEAFFLDFVNTTLVDNNVNSNVLFKKWFMVEHNCKLTGMAHPTNPSITTPCPTSLTSADYVQDKYVEPAIDSVYVFANALKRAWETKCGAGTKGNCTALHLTTYNEVHSFLKETSLMYSNAERIARYATANVQPEKRVKHFKFDNYNNPQEVMYTVYNLNDNGGSSFVFQRVDTFIDGGVFVDSFPLARMKLYNITTGNAVSSVPAIKCISQPCKNCLATRRDPTYRYIPGSVVIVGIFPIHMPGSDMSSCGPLNPDGVQLMEAFLYEIENINVFIKKQFNHTYTTAVIGGLGIDSCASSLITASVLNDIRSGQLIIKSGAQTLDFNAFIGYVGAYTAATNAELTKFLASKYVQIGYHSRSPSMKDATAYPLYYQTVPWINDELKAIVSVLRALDMTYIQIVYLNDEHHTFEQTVFQTTAKMHGICVAATHMVTSGTTEKEVTDKLLLKQAAKAVVVFSNVAGTRALIQGVYTLATNKFVLIAGTDWGTQKGVVDGLNAMPTGAITLYPEGVTTPGFTAYLSQTRDATTSVNPWYSEWYQSLNACRLPNAPFSSSGTACTTKDKPVTQASTFSPSMFASSTINAVDGLTSAVVDTVWSLCGNKSDVCDAFKNHNDIQSQISGRLARHDFAFTTNSGEKFSFTERAYMWKYGVYNTVNNGTYKKVGDYNPLNNEVKVNRSDIRFASSALRSSTCIDLRHCGECTQSSNVPQYMYIAGDILIGILVSVHRQGPTSLDCGGVLVRNGFQYTEVAAWALDYINAGSKADVKLGGSLRVGAVIFDTCNSGTRAISIVNGVLSNTLQLTDSATQKAIDTTKIKTWIVYGDAITAATYPLIRRYNVPVISPSAGLDEFSGKIHRTVPSNKRQIDTFFEVVKQTGWSCVQVVNSPTPYGQSMAKLFREQAFQKGICITSCLEFSSDGSDKTLILKLLEKKHKTVVVVLFSDQSVATKNFLKARGDNADAAQLIIFGGKQWGADFEAVTGGLAHNATNNSLIVQVNSPQTVTPVTNYMATLKPAQNSRNMWFDAYYQALFNCSLGASLQYTTPCDTSKPLTAAPKYEQDIYTMSTVNAVNSAVKNFGVTLAKQCGSNYTTLCSSFIDEAGINEMLTRNLQNVTVLTPTGATFAFLNEMDGNMGFVVWRNAEGAYKKEISHMLGSVTGQVKSYYPGVAASCRPCDSCPKSLDRTIKFMYQPGQVLIAGIFPVHEPGGAPFSCGHIQSSGGVLRAEAFRFALEQIRSHPLFRGRLTGVSIGGVVLDNCGSAILSQSLITDVHGGVTVLRDSSGSAINPDDVVAYVSGMDTAEAVQDSLALNELGMPLVSYRATATFLTHEPLTYPNFARTMPNDRKTAAAIISFLKRYSLQNIQVVYSPTVYGRRGLEDLQAAAADEFICIAQTVMFPSSDITQEDVRNVVAALLKRPNATTVVTFAPKRYLKPLLENVKASNNTRDAFFFIGSTDWSHDLDVVANVSARNLRNIITFGPETADILAFETYLKSKSPANYKEDPWFNEYYEKLFQCSLNDASPNYATKCASDKLSLVDSTRYRQGADTLYIMNAVFSAALGIDKALQQICGVNYAGLCNDFVTSGEKRQRILAAIKTVEFVDAKNQLFKYDSSGDNNRGFHIYELISVADKPQYVHIGSYNDTFLLKLKSDFRVNWYSNCSQPGSCRQCPDLGKRRSAYMQQPSTLDVSVAAYIPVHKVKNTVECGDLDMENGFKNLLAFFYGIDTVNTDIFRALPALKLGGIAVDYCSNVGRLQERLFSYTVGEGLCRAANFSQMISPLNVLAYVTYDNTATRAAMDILRLPAPGITVISPEANSEVFENVDLYPRLLRIRPPDAVQINILYQIAMLNGWTNMMFVYENTTYGMAGAKVFHDLVASKNYEVCVSLSEGISAAMSPTEADALVRKMDANFLARYVILYASPNNTRVLLTAIKNLNLAGRFTFLATDLWSSKPRIVKDLEMISLGLITLEISNPIVDNFTNWVNELGLPKEKRKGIPTDWFEEFWQRSMQCRIRGSIVEQSQYVQECSATGRLPATAFAQESVNLHTIMATHVVAEAIASLYNTAPAVCSNQNVDVCLMSKTRDVRNALVYDRSKRIQLDVLKTYLGNASFPFKFTEQRHGDLGFRVLNYVRTPTGFQFKNVGSYLEQLKMAQFAVETYDRDGFALARAPESVCPPTANCNCRRPATQSDAPVDTDDVDTDDCWDRLRHTRWAPVVVGLSGLGVLVVLLLVIFFACVYPVQGRTTILGYMILLGVLIVFLVNIPLMADACFTACILRRLFLGIGYSMIFAAFLLKVMNNYRLGDSDDIDAYHRLGSPAAMFGIFTTLVGVQCGIAVEWIILEHGKSTAVAYRGAAYLRCAPGEFYDTALVLSTVYVMFLIVLTVAFGFVTFDYRSNSHESRWICFVSCMVAGCFLVWCLVAALTEYKYRDGAVAVANLFNGFLILVFVYARKIGILQRARNNSKKAAKVESAYNNNGYNEGTIVFDEY